MQRPGRTSRSADGSARIGAYTGPRGDMVDFLEEPSRLQADVPDFAVQSPSTAALCLGAGVLNHRFMDFQVRTESGNLPVSAVCRMIVIESCQAIPFIQRSSTFSLLVQRRRRLLIFSHCLPRWACTGIAGAGQAGSVDSRAGI